MDAPPPATLLLATCNVLNLASPGRLFYANQDVYSADEYARKIDWLGAQIRRLNADVIAFQEVWDGTALRDALAASGLLYPHLAAPGAEQGETGTPRVAIASRWPVRELTSHAASAAAQSVAVPEIGEIKTFERPILEALIETPGERGTMRVLVAHLKSKLPKFLHDAAGEALEDRDAAAIQARALLRSLTQRAAEAVALRVLMHSRLARARAPGADGRSERQPAYGDDTDHRCHPGTSPSTAPRATRPSFMPSMCKAMQRSAAAWPTRMCTRAGPRCWSRSGFRRSSSRRTASPWAKCAVSSTSTTTCRKAASASVPTTASCAL